MESQLNVSMGTFVPLHIQILRYQLSWSISFTKIQTFTCFISRLYGALIMKLITKEINVCTRITGRTSEENHNSTTIPRSNVRTGVQDPSLTTTEMAAQMNTHVHKVMDGRNRSIILKTLNWILVSMEINAWSRTVHTITVHKIEGNLYSNGLRSFQRQD
jgi:hypothetical protein